MTSAQEMLKFEVEKISDEPTLEKLKIYIMGILTQQGLEQTHALPNSCKEMRKCGIRGIN